VNLQVFQLKIPENDNGNEMINIRKAISAGSKLQEKNPGGE